MKIRALWLAIVATGAVALPAQGPQNVLLVVNGNSADSRAIADYYQQKRSIPASNVCKLAVQASESVDAATYERAIRQPIAQCIAGAGLQDKILYIVLTKGVPLIVVRTPAPKLDDASVDSALTLLYPTLLRIALPATGKIPNAYFARNAAGNPVRFSHREFTMYLVTRLDGYDVTDVKALIDRGLASSTSATKDGRFILDRRSDEEGGGNRWLDDAASRLRAAGVASKRIQLEATGQFLTGQDHVLGYASWGSNDPSDRSRYLKNQWLPGALMAEFVSTDARTFQRPPDKWNIGSWKDSHTSFYADSPQSLIGDAIHEGVTGVSGNVSEPLLEACVRPQILFPAYVQGLNLAEAYYAAMPYLNWKGVVIGDPLVSPFARTPLLAADADPGTDAALGVPTFFAKHLVITRARALGETPETTALMMQAERLVGQKNFAAAKQAVERAYKLSPDSFRTIQLMAQFSPPEQAIPLYRRVIDIAPQDASALNNLAYILAEMNRPKEALPLAARAADLAQGRNGAALDTYGWVLYLLGQYPEACKNLENAVQLQPASAENAYHLGMCYIKSGRAAEGRARLERALTLNPSAPTAAAIHKAL